MAMAVLREIMYVFYLLRILVVIMLYIFFIFSYMGVRDIITVFSRNYLTFDKII